MAFRELMMIDVKEVLRRWQAGQSVRRIGEGAGIDRKTVQRYIDAAEACGVPRDGELDDDVVHQVAQRVQGRPKPEASEAWAAVAERSKEIAAWLGGPRPLKLSKVHVLLGRLGAQASYATLRRCAMAELGWREPEATTVRIDDAPPGQEAQVDFGVGSSTWRRARCACCTR